ncbi:MAG TPA: PIN domain-containing protein [Polyangiaceae bacterium]|nr:PIN domain-containing protein [Polyangiaceae bacterium]
MKLLLDTSVLGWACHPRKHGEVRAWLRRAVAIHELLVSEVADYELRRELLRIGATRSVARLDELGRELSYVPVTTATWRSAARLWAVLRRDGVVTAPPEALDADVLIAVQAIAEGAAVVTSNVRHFESVVRAMEWKDVPQT